MLSGGDTLTHRQREDILAAVEAGRRRSGLNLTVRIGPVEGNPRVFARRRHAELGAEAPDSVLVFVDPVGRKLEIVTGSRARRCLDDGACRAAATTMTAAFALGNLAGGLVAGLRALAESARAPQSVQTHRT